MDFYWLQVIHLWFQKINERYSQITIFVYLAARSKRRQKHFTKILKIFYGKDSFIASFMQD
jgi:hypothetical protein